MFPKLSICANMLMIGWFIYSPCFPVVIHHLISRDGERLRMKSIHEAHESLMKLALIIVKLYRTRWEHCIKLIPEQQWAA